MWEMIENLYKTIRIQKKKLCVCHLLQSLNLTEHIVRKFRKFLSINSLNLCFSLDRIKSELSNSDMIICFYLLSFSFLFLSQVVVNWLAFF